jgi:tetratricopeptide (TPR) repeat protein
MVFFSFNYRGRGAALGAIFFAMLIPTAAIGDFTPPMGLGFFYAVNFLLTAIGSYLFARYCERNRFRKIQDPKTGMTEDVPWRDEFFRIPVKYWPYLFLAGSVACAVGALNPGSETFRDRGDTYIKRGEDDFAIDAYTSAIRLDPSDYRAFNGRGFAYDNKGDYDHAIADFTEAIRLKPDYATAFVNRGFVYDRKRDYERAIADLTEAIRLDPKFAKAFSNRGWAYSHKGEYDRAITDYTEAIRLKPDYQLAFHNRGIAYRNKGEYGQAIADATEAIRLDRKDADAFNSRGLAYDYKGEYNRAIADYSEAIRLKPSYSAAYRNRGLAYMDKGEHDQAIADFSEAIRLNPQYAAALRERGYTYFFKGNFSGAAEDMRRSNALAVNAYAMLWRVMALGRMGQEGDAELSANAGQLKTTDWPHVLIDFWLGRRTLEEAQDAANTPEQRCEAAYYIAEWRLLHGRRTEAQAGLQQAAGACSKTSVEYAGAIEDLKRLGR